MPYVRVSHGLDTNYIFNGVFPEGSLTSEDESLLELMSKSLINFAYTGSPYFEPDPQKHASEWPSAYLKSKVNFDLSEIVQVLGGPYGAGSVIVNGKNTTDSAEEAEIDAEALGLGNMQQALPDVLNFEAMKSRTSEIRDRLARKEKLLVRCAYVKSLAETLGV